MVKIHLFDKVLRSLRNCQKITNYNSTSMLTKLHIEEPGFEKKAKEAILNMVSNHSEIYKYTNFEIGLKIISGQTLAFRSPLNMNDPFDCDISLIDFSQISQNYIEYLILKYPSRSDELSKLLPRTSSNEYIYNHIIDAQTRGLKQDLSKRGLTCFSETFSNPLMWSHYTTSHSGICIGFDFKKLYTSIRKSSNPERLITKVEYSETFVAVDYYKYPREAILNWLKMKSIDWKYEKEVRILLYDLNFDVNGLHIHSIDPDCIKSIFLGAKISLENEKIIRDLVVSKFRSITIKKMSPVKNSFCLEAL